MPQGVFIVFEGLDGSGISTQSKMLANWLKKQGRKILLTKEPTENFAGGFIRKILKKEQEISPLALQLLFTADRAHHLAAKIEPALKEGKVVICDRYIMSTVAFGSLTIDKSFLVTANSNFRAPDLTIIIDTPPEVCIERIKKGRNGEYELFEKIETLRRVRQAYIDMTDLWSNVQVVDGNRRQKEVFNDIKKVVEQISSNR